MNYIEAFEAQQINKLKADRSYPEIKPGYTIKVSTKIREGANERLQDYEGVVIAIYNKGINSSFLVRKISYDEGVERKFMFYSPNIANIQVIRKGRVRRAKLYYLRSRRGKSARLKEDRRNSSKAIAA